MPKISQIFNNNVALIDLDNHGQAVVKGRGIAFQKKRGDVIPVNQIEKIFYLASEVSRQNLYFLLKNIPIDVVTTTYEIIDTAQRQYHLKVFDYIYITLSDHIYEAYKRYQAGTYQETMIPDFHAQYPNEYAVAYHALQIIAANLGVHFPKSEAKSLALHFINASGEGNDEQDFGKSNEVELSQLVQTVLKRHHITRTHLNGNYYDRFMIHLQYLIDRLQRVDSDASAIAPEVATDLKKNYPHSYEIASEIYDEIKRHLYHSMGENERLYFIIHIQRLIDEAPFQK